MINIDKGSTTFLFEKLFNNCVDVFKKMVLQRGGVNDDEGC